LRQRFVLPGFRKDLDQLLPWASILALPSLTEGLPNVVLEAMAARVPVVATAAGGTPELVTDGVTGHLVPPRDAAALGERLLRLLRSASARREMGETGCGRVERHFTFQAQSAAYQQVFRAVVEPRKRDVWHKRLPHLRFQEAHA
jgi:glycosyltransferase involved in cell wall biosynthesis